MPGDGLCMAKGLMMAFLGTCWAGGMWDLGCGIWDVEGGIRAGYYREGEYFLARMCGENVCASSIHSQSPQPAADAVSSHPMGQFNPRRLARCHIEIYNTPPLLTHSQRKSSYLAPSTSNGNVCFGMLNPNKLANHRMPYKNVGERSSSVWWRKGRAG